MLKLKFQYFGHLMWRTDSWKRSWCWKRLKVGDEGDDRGWDGWMASPTRWTWVWASPRNLWRTGTPCVLQSMGLQRAGRDWATELSRCVAANGLWYVYLMPHHKLETAAAAAAAAASLQSCPTLCGPRDRSPPGTPVPGTLQARTLERVAISFSNAWKWKEKEKSLSRVRLLATPWSTAYQAPPSMGFSRQKYWSGVSLVKLDNCYNKSPKFYTGLQAYSSEFLRKLDLFVY